MKDIITVHALVCCEMGQGEGVGDEIIRRLNRNRRPKVGSGRRTTVSVADVKQKVAVATLDRKSRNGKWLVARRELDADSLHEGTCVFERCMLILADRVLITDESFDVVERLIRANSMNANSRKDSRRYGMVRT